MFVAEELPSIWAHVAQLGERQIEYQNGPRFDSERGQNYIQL